jgi:hypothetical protein
MSERALRVFEPGGSDLAPILQGRTRGAEAARGYRLTDNPIHRYRGGLAWQAKFLASAEIEDG